MTSRRVRTTTAGLLALGAVMFTVGTAIEQAGHVETAAQHAGENRAPASSPSPVPSRTPASVATTASPPIARPTPKPAPARDPGLSAAEGSKEREAAEHRKRVASASTAAAAVRGPAPRASATLGASALASTAVATAVAVADAKASEGSAAREAAEVASGYGAPTHGEAGERLFGVNTESTPIVVAADLLALVLIGLVLLLTGAALRLAGLAVAVSGLGAVGLDIREAIHQHGLGRSGLVVLVLGVALLHLGNSAGGVVLARPSAPAASPEPLEPGRPPEERRRG